MRVKCFSGTEAVFLLIDQKDHSTLLKWAGFIRNQLNRRDLSDLDPIFKDLTDLTHFSSTICYVIYWKCSNTTIMESQ